MERETEVQRLAELVRLGEKALRQQLEIAAGQDEKSRHLIATAMAFLTATAALVGWTVKPLPFFHLVPLLGILSGGLMFLTRGFQRLSLAYLGSAKRPVRLQVGWGGSRLVKARDTQMDLSEIHKATVQAIQAWMKHNETLMKRTGTLRRQGVSDLMRASVFLAAALIYVVIANAI